VFLANPPSYDEVAHEFAWENTFQEERQKRLETEPVAARVSAFLKHCKGNYLPDRDPMFLMARKHAPKGNAMRVLDIGSGKGHRVHRFCQRFANRGIEAIPTGIEISPALAQISNGIFQSLGGRVVADTAMDGVAQLEAESFDVVIMQCYLEHEAKPLEVLKRTWRIVSQGGVVLVKVPNYDSLNRRWRGRRWCGFRFPDHVNYFTPPTLEILAREAGFDMVPQAVWDRPPTSDNMYAVFKRSVGAVQTPIAA
jgi:2-polyprenyl-3-methyl-5-hydroxy-6-metoxy-1,4-benzoquinol methylase